MPKNSLTCNMFELLNELNKIRVNGKLLGKDIKTRIVEELFMNKKIIKEKDLKKWFVTNKVYLEINEISGYQKDGLILKRFLVLLMIRIIRLLKELLKILQFLMKKIF